MWNLEGVLVDRLVAVEEQVEIDRARAVAGALAPDAAKVAVIPHGAFTHLAGLEPAPLPLPDPGARPVVLFFGLIRPYKGLDVLLDAWRGIDDAELWVVGNARMDVGPLRAAAPPNVRWLERFVSDAEAAALFRRADVAVLPYRQIDQSGVLFTALAFGTPLIFNQIAMTLFMMIDRFFLEGYGKARDVGVYAIANTLVGVVSVLATVPFSQVWTVMRFSVMNEEGADEYYSRVLTYITFVSMFLSLGVAAVTPMKRSRP